jgi:hypothetical protein
MHFSQNDAFHGQVKNVLQVPLEPRFMWRQRLRWLKGGHLFLISKDSLFYKKQPHMSFYQKSLYWLCPVAHIIQIWAEPVIFTLPFLCLVLNVCPYGMDRDLFISHLVFFVIMNMSGALYGSWDMIVTAIRAKSGYRILWFTSVKAVLNTIMVVTGWKAKGHFKFTPKAGLAGDDKGMVDDTVVLDSTESSQSEAQKNNIKTAPEVAVSAADTPGQSPTKPNTVRLHRGHAGLSRISELRKHCLPMDGTLDVWVLMATTLLAIFSAAVGIRRLIFRDAIARWNENGDTLIWIGIVFALVDSVPGLLFAGCAFGFLQA